MTKKLIESGSAKPEVVGSTLPTGAREKTERGDGSKERKLFGYSLMQLYVRDGLSLDFNFVTLRH